MTERERFEKWLNTLDKQTLVTMTSKQARTIEELQAATKASLPEGWKLVPVEPTEEMVDAFIDSDIDLDPEQNVIIGYKAMLEAVPDGDK